MKYHVFILCLIWPFLAWPQEEAVLASETYYDLIREYHPVARRAVLISSRGELAVREARGAFDPKLMSGYSRKEFEGKDYYDIWEAYVEVPTLLNIDLKAGYERNRGLFLNPERTVPDGGLYYAGVSVPIGQGLIRNERSVALSRSRFLEKGLENEANRVLNNLFLDANHAYWWWYEYMEKVRVVQESLRLMTERFMGIREAVLNGEQAAIDSVEMGIQIRQWTNQLNSAELDVRNSKLLLENFIWNEEVDIAGLAPKTDLPQETLEIAYFLEQAASNHPELRQLSIENRLLAIDQKWSQEQLKPVINLNYNVLLEGTNQLDQQAFYSNNYKLEAQFAFPLLIRKERAKLQQVKVKQQENAYKVDQKYREVTNKVRQYYNKVMTLREMIRQQELIVRDYDRMLKAEQIKFENGESSVFLLNSRENKKLEGELKLIELKAACGRAIGALDWSAGMNSLK